MRKVRRGDCGRLDLRSALPAFLLGFLAASFQLYLLREFSAHFFGNELTFGLFLGSWLLWGGVGSLARPGPRRPSGGLAVPYSLTIIIFFSGLTLLRFSHRLMGMLPGEMTGLAPALVFALVLAFLLSFPLGHFFVLNSGLLGGNVPRVYFLESLGAATSGLLVHFLLVPRFSNWEGAAVISAAAVLLMLTGMKPAKGRAVLAVTVALSAAVSWLDLPSQKAAWKPLTLVEAKDTPYGKLQVIRTEDQVSLLSNGLPLFSSPDPAGAEESVHFALLQRPGARRILLIGGGASGGAAEVLKYPGAELDCVELDPAVMSLAEKYLPPPEFAPLRNPRVRIVIRDGRAFSRTPRAGTTPSSSISRNRPRPRSTAITLANSFSRSGRSSRRAVSSASSSPRPKTTSVLIWPGSWPACPPLSATCSLRFWPSPERTASFWLPRGP